MNHQRYSRRHFLACCTAGSALPLLGSIPEVSAAADTPPDAGEKSLEDPVKKLLTGEPDLGRILKLFPRTTGDPAFDLQDISQRAVKLRTTPSINTGHPFLDLSVRTGLAHIDATFDGDHPRYGVGDYSKPEHDGFPPTIIAAVDALSAWGLHERARQLWKYWLKRFVREDGRIDYYGPAISEYGQLLHTAALMEERAGLDGWWHEGFQALDRMAELLLALRASATGSDGLISGVPEADTRKEVFKYFHNNAWVVRGLRRWAELCQRCEASPKTSPAATLKVAQALREDLLSGIRQTWPSDPEDWWLPPRLEPMQKPARLTGAPDVASYTNYRYWPELLSSGVLPADLSARVVNARLTAGGQFCGMTRFAAHLDDWPLAEYLTGVWALGRRNDFLLSLYGHVAYHQAEGHLTAYEQVSLPPGKKKADYCLPCQLVAARAARRLQRT
jgi:hypothetical protein